MNSSRPYQMTSAFDSRPEQIGKMNLFDLSHAHVSSFKMGQLVPFITEETLPGDVHFIQMEFMNRYARMYLPIMHRVNFSMDLFYIPNRILWPGTKNDSWEYFINPSNTNSVGRPYVNLTVSALTSGNTIQEYMGVPTPSGGGTLVSTIEVSALPISAYLKVYDEYYRNDQLTDPLWFELVSGNNTNDFNTAIAPGTAWVPLYRLWNRDYFTSATPEPQKGADVLVPIMRNDTVDQLDPTWNYKGPTQWLHSTTDMPVGAGTLSTNAQGRTQESDIIYLDIQETSATIRDLRFAIQLTEFLERAMRLGDKYRDMLKGFWDSDPDPGIVDRPVFIGGKKGRVVISEVMTTAQADAIGAQPATFVGDYSGQALALDSTGTIKYKCREHGWILGLVSVYPQSMYMNGLHRKWTRETAYDYAWEQFALIGDDAILGRELNYQFETSKQDYNTAPWGYIPRYSEYRYSNDVVAGQMRDAFLPFTLVRAFAGGTGSEIALNNEFVTCQPDRERVFQVDSAEDEIYSYIYITHKVLRRLPKFGIPSI